LPCPQPKNQGADITTFGLLTQNLCNNAGMKNKPITHWLLYCRPGFEQDCAQEALRQAKQQKPIIGIEQPAIIADSGYVIVALNDQTLSYRELIFARQLIRLHQTIAALSERDRLTPILDAISTLPGTFGALWLEVPDTNDGKLLTTFTRRFQPLLETALREQGRLLDETINTVRAESVEASLLHPSTSSGRTEETSPRRNNHLPRLHIFFPDKSSVLIGTSDLHNSAAAIMGIVRQSMPAEAPSRSTMKLAEAIEVFMDRSEQTRLLRQGMTAVDLGAAPGGWTWQLVKRGIRVTAVDNGPMKGVLANHPLVQHLKQDGFKYAPRKAVDWLVCDMVEQPSKVATLIGAWFAAGWCKHAIFNLKLPMKKRIDALDSALGGIRKRLDEEGINYRMIAKQLYHDREEVTVFLTKTKG
jgi:23S rRNA (cytidine2498-2'-O)-methyltransferase